MSGSSTVLAMRLRELKEDVTTVQGVLARLLLRGSHLDDLKRLVMPRLAGQTITVPLRRAAADAKRLADAAKDEPQLAQLLELEDIDAGKVVKHLTEAQERLAELGQVINAMTVFDLEKWTNELQGNLEVCVSVLNEIKGLEKLLADGGPVREVWAGLEEVHRTSCRALFADYVDLLSGMVLRDTHLDDEISAITDDFLDQLASPRLVVPARRSELPSLLNSLVKIGFPEWTVWDVPLVAHHAGVLRTRAMDNDQGLRQSLPARPREVRRCLFADFYATQVAGPAYVCAMLLLRLDPAAAPTGVAAATDHERAYVIRNSLTFREPPGDFEAFVRGVGDDWDAAVEQNAEGPLGLDTAGLDDFIQRSRAFLRMLPVVTFGAVQWQAARDRLEPLFSKPELAVSDSADSTLDLLNVAWVLRREGAIDAGRLQRRVMSLWSSGAGGPGRPPPAVGHGQSPNPGGGHG